MDALSPFSAIKPPASLALDAMGIDHRLFLHEGSVSSFEQAARERGQRPAQIVRSILFQVKPGEFVMVLMAGPAQVDWKKLRQIVKRSRVRMATEDEVLEVTGYRIGTVSPFGVKNQARVMIDASVLREEEVSIGSGVRNTAIILKSADLRRALNGAEFIEVEEVLRTGDVVMVSLRDLLRLASRTFAIGIEQLPAVLCDAGTVAYLLLRVSDYLEDNEDMPAEKKIELLNLWAGILNGDANCESLTSQIQEVDTSNPDAVVAQHARDILERLALLPNEVREIITHHVIHSTQGMARWVARGPHMNDEADMDDYMFEVAGRVGYLLTHLFAWYSRSIRVKIKELLPLAREFGLALQTVNVIRGLRKDYDRGWVYVPKKFLEAANVSVHELFQPGNRAEAIKVLDMLADKAERHLHAALTCIKTLPPWQHRIRLACIFPLMFAIRTLAISRRNTDVFNHEAKITREEVKRIVRDTTLWGWSNAWLDRYSKKLHVGGEK